MSGYDFDWDKLERDGMCECGQPSSPALHTPLPYPKALASWMSTKHAENKPPKKPGRPFVFGPRPPARERLQPVQRRRSTRMRQVLAAVKARNGNQSAAARDLGVSTTTVRSYVIKAEEMALG